MKIAASKAGFRSQTHHFLAGEMVMECSSRCSPWALGTGGRGHGWLSQSDAREGTREPQPPQEGSEDRVPLWLSEPIPESAGWQSSGGGAEHPSHREGCGCNRRTHHCHCVGPCLQAQRAQGPEPVSYSGGRGTGLREVREPQGFRRPRAAWRLSGLSCCARSRRGDRPGPDLVLDEWAHH